MKFFVTKTADLDSRGIACCHCGKLLSTFDKATNSQKPTDEQLLAAGGVPVPNFGWFCSQNCGNAYSREHGVEFQRDVSGKIAYY